MRVHFLPEDWTAWLNYPRSLSYRRFSDNTAAEGNRSVVGWNRLGTVARELQGLGMRGAKDIFVECDRREMPLLCDCAGDKDLSNGDR